MHHHGIRAAYKDDEMIRRPAHGATRRPPVERPGSGYGRPVRSGPPARLRGMVVHARSWDPSELLVVSLIERDDAALAS
jgi:hypothetical protein